MSLNSTPIKSTGFKQWVFKKLTMATFLVLPARISSVFVSLSIINLLYSVRDTAFTDNEAAVKRVEEMLRVKLDSSVMLLPERTYNWYWDNDFLSAKVSTKEGVYSMRQLITDTTMLTANWDKVMDYLIASLPKSLITKLHLKYAINRLIIKSNVRAAVLHSSY